jgi:hypothetical protein
MNQITIQEIFIILIVMQKSLFSFSFQLTDLTVHPYDRGMRLTLHAYLHRFFPEKEIRTKILHRKSIYFSLQLRVFVETHQLHR